MTSTPTPRFELIHRRVVRFRPAVIVELLIGSLLTFCILPLAVALLLVAHALGLDLPGFDELLERAFPAVHELLLQRFDAAGKLAGEERFTPRDAAEGEALFQQALARAAEAGLPLLERVEGEVRASWDPQRPLAEPAGGPDTAELLSRARAAGYTVQVEGGTLRLQADKAPVPAAAAVVMLVLASPFAVWFPHGRARLQDLVQDLRGAPPERLTLQADAGGLRLRRERFGALREEQAWARERIAALGILALPSYGDRVRPTDEQLTVRGVPDAAIRLPGPREGWEAVRALLVRALVGTL